MEWECLMMSVMLHASLGSWGVREQLTSAGINRTRFWTFNHFFPFMDSLKLRDWLSKELDPSVHI